VLHIKILSLKHVNYYKSEYLCTGDGPGLQPSDATVILFLCNRKEEKLNVRVEGR